ncbi:hypothetical protein HPB51_024202 [Rhipicephalus microplus]|uniref:Uncharacterized protein n=1 Tax=Rhipicephalus microplus TaxID=6941 RepID=A0A9J6DWX3_RHIMP|nr:hypothetical protein HPB51_024202 [Rhipicephalus microplus]
MCACMCRAVPTRKTTAREARPRGCVTRAFGSARGAQGHNSLPPEHVCRRLPFVDSGAEPLEFDAATLRLPTSSLQVTTPHNVDFATEWCRRGINDGPGYYPDDLNLREVRRSRQDYLVGRLAHRYDPGHVATLVPAEWTAQPPLDDRSRRAGARFLNLSLSRWSWRAGAGCLDLPLRRCSRRAGGGFRGGLQVLKGTTPCRRNTCVVGSRSSTVALSHWSSTRRPCVSRPRHCR